MRKYRRCETVLRDFRLKEIFAEQEDKVDKGMILYEDWIVRPQAIIEALRRIPPDYYDKLKSIAPSIIWVFEVYNFLEYGHIYRIPIQDIARKEVPGRLIHYILIMRLSYRLELFPDWERAIYTVAHELAHCWFFAFDPFAFSDEKEEERVITLILQWGFGQEYQAQVDYEKELLRNNASAKAKKKRG